MNQPILATYLAAAATLLSASYTSCSEPRPEKADLVLLYTTDVHGACLPFDIRLNRPAKTSLANVCNYVNQQRAEHPDAVMLFDTGDFLQGQPSIYYYNFIDTLGQHIVPAIDNYIGYDAIGVGNHDIETGEECYNKRLPQQFAMPWICANAIDQRTGKPMFQPYCVIERQGIKIAVLGMITPNIAAWLPKQKWANLEFEDMVECAQHWVPIIQQTEHPDLLVGLFHSGSNYKADGADLDTYKNENGGLPAAIKVPGFDIVLCGHDHQQKLDKIVNVNGDTITVLDAETQARMVGRADIHLTLDAKTGRYHKQIDASLIDMTDYAPDSAFCATFQYAVDTVNAFVDRPLGTLTAPLVGEPSLYGPSEFMDFIHGAQLWATQADISFASVLSPHDVVPAGPITMRHLFTLYKYENQLFTIKMKGAEVQRFLEFGFDRQFGTMRTANDHLLAFLTDEQGEIMTNAFGPRLKTQTFNFTSAAGIRYVVDVSKPDGEKLSIHSMSDGTPFDPEREYTVAINSYQYSGGGNFIPEGLGWDEKTLEAHTLDASPRDVRSYVVDYIKYLGTITPQLRGDWEVIPINWWYRGRERDARLLNPKQR